MSVIAAISTPDAVGGIGVIRISGAGADAIADRVFRPAGKKRLTELPGYRAAYGHVYDGEALLDECVALVFRAPHSFTGEDTVELSCHGGLYVTRRVLRAVLDAGARPADRGEFTKRAFLNGKIDLAEAESVMNVIGAAGDRALRAAAQTGSGALSRKLAALRGRLTHLSAALAYWSDDPDEDVPEADPDALGASLDGLIGELDTLTRDYDNGKAFTEGVRCVICGSPNVGKSTLMNLLAGEERSIVTEIPGTTRDVVEETVRLGDVLLRLADTAGLRQTGDVVEAIGVQRARERIGQAELILAVFDASEPLTHADRELLEACGGRRCVIVLNKTDLPPRVQVGDVAAYASETVLLSAKTGEGAQALTEAINRVCAGDAAENALLLTGERQRQCCQRARSALADAREALAGGVTLDAVSVLLDEALRAMMEMTGENVSDAVIGEVFARFCVGK